MAEKVYVYHEYTDSEAFGELLTKVFADEECGKTFLRLRVKRIFGETLEQLHFKATEEDTVTDTYVSIGNGDETSFFVLEEHDVL